MKEKILTAIKTKYPTAKLSAKRLDAIAASIEAKAGTDETLIDSTLDALNELYPLTEIAKDDHIRSSAEGKLKALQTGKKEEKKPEDEGADEAKPPTNDDAPAWLKTLMDQQKSLVDTVNALKTEKQQTTIKSKVAEKLKDIPAIVWNGRALPDKEEDIDGFVTGVTTEYAEYEKSSNNTQLGFLGKPKSGSGNGASGQKASKEEIDALVGNLLPAKQNLS